MWFYLISRLLAITIVVVPVCTGLAMAIISYLQQGRSIDGYLAWGYTLFYFTWTNLLFVLVPYCWIFIEKKLTLSSLFLKFILFYTLMIMMGLLFPDGSIIGIFNGVNPYPRVLIIYFFLTISVCPLCNIFLTKIVNTLAAQGDEDF